MSTEVPKTPTDPTVDPDNFHVTDEPLLPEGVLADGKTGTVKPDNFHVTDEPA